MTKADKFWTGVIVLLVIVIVIGSLVIWAKYRPGQPIEITLTPPEEFHGEIYVTGAVNSPGIYPLKTGDSIADVLRAAGGTGNNADLMRLKLYVPGTEADGAPQKVDVNRAEKWLLQALPGVGETRAQAIIDYRAKNGRFRSINELMKVEGIGPTTYDKMKDLITVGD